MVNKTKKSGAKKGKVKVGKLKVNKETVQDLTGSTKKKVKGGVAGIEVAGSGPWCTKDFYCANYPTRLCR